MDFLSDFWQYCQCYEVPRNYALWSAISMVQAAMHRKIYFLKGDIEVHSADYPLLVGPMGNKKSTPCDFVKEIFREACPTLAIGASNQTAEDIVKAMCADDFEREFVN